MFRCLCIIVLIRLLGFWYLISHENVDKNGSVEAQIIYKDHNYYEAIILSKDINPFILNHYINFYHEAPLDKGSIYLLSYAIKTKHFRYSWFSQVFDRTHDQVILNSLPIFVSYGQKSLREKWIIYLDKIIPEHTLRPLVRALIWGDRQDVSDQIYGLFTQTGTAHILAISGLHVAWVVCMFTGLMQSIPLAIIIGWLYVIFAMLPPSGVRAMLMVTLDYMFPKLGWIYIFIFTLLIHLLIFPIDIFSMSTLLSYWAIIMIRFITVFTEGGLFGFSINLSLLMMPISLYFFHQWPIASLWLNLMVVPLFSFIVLPLILFSLFASFLGITSLWNIVYGVLLYVVKLLQYFESWPKIYLFDHLFLSAFVIQASLIYFMVKRPNWLVVVCLVFIFYLVVHHPIKVPYNNFSIVMLDVGQGLSVWIKTKHHAVLYDAGPKYAGYKVLLPFIMSQKPNELSHIIISHWDQDHVGGLTAIRSKTKAKIITSDPALGEPCLYGQSFELDGVNFKFYHPTNHRHKSKNKNSCVLLVSNQKHSAILLGDIDQQDEKKLVSRLWGQSVDLMVAAHHGSQGSNGYPLLYTLHPKIIWVSAGRHNPYHHPHKESMNRFYSVTNQVMVTAVDGQQYFHG